MYVTSQYIYFSGHSDDFLYIQKWREKTTENFFRDDKGASNFKRKPAKTFKNIPAQTSVKIQEETIEKSYRKSLEDITTETLEDASEEIPAENGKNFLNPLEEFY